jgi:hypothetical protein
MHREVAMVIRAATPTHLHLRERLSRIALVTVGVDLVATALVYLFDHKAKGTEIRTVGDALFWTTCQLLTVSSQLKNPISTGARIVDVGVELWSITVIATLAGAFGAFFHRRGLERHPIGESRASSL